jgi:hypothetical protein
MPYMFHQPYYPYPPVHQQYYQQPIPQQPHYYPNNVSPYVHHSELPTSRAFNVGQASVYDSQYNPQTRYIPYHHEHHQSPFHDDQSFANIEFNQDDNAEQQFSNTKTGLEEKDVDA